MRHLLRPVVAAWARTLVVESSLVLGAQAFLALFPLLIVAYAVAPPRLAQNSVETMRNRFGLTGQSADAVTLLASRDVLRGGLSVVGFILVIASATAFTRALQRVYERAWELPKLGLRGGWRWLAWLAGLLMYLALLGAAVHATQSLHVGGAIGAVVGLFLWWWTPYLLLGGRVRWRSLAYGAVFTGLGQLIVGQAAAVLIPRMIRSSEATYGPIGVVFTIETWLIASCGVLVVGAALGAAVARDHGGAVTLIRGNPRPGRWRAGHAPLDGGAQS